MREIRVNLPEVLARRRLNRKQLADATGLRYATLSELYHGRTKPSLATLETVINGIEQLSGQPVPLTELLETVQLPASENDLLESSVGDLRTSLLELEADTDPEELAAWHAAFAG